MLNHTCGRLTDRIREEGTDTVQGKKYRVEAGNRTCQLRAGSTIRALSISIEGSVRRHSPLG